MPRLDQIRIAGYKSIRDQTIDLRDLNVLIGANGAGKSNFLEILLFLRQIPWPDSWLAQRGGARRLLHFGPKVTKELCFSLKLDDLTYHVTLKPTENNSFVFEDETLSAKTGAYATASSTSLQHWMNNGPLQTEAAQLVTFFSELRVYHFNDTSPFSSVRLGGDSLSDNLQLHPDGSNLAAILHRFQREHPAHFRNLVDTVRLVAPFLEELILEPEPGVEFISSRWKHRGADEVLPASALSDGTLRFLCLATVLLQPKLPGILLFDEPELGLHPAALHLLAGLMRSAATRTQVILATQSVTLLNQFTAEDILVVERQGEESVFRRPPLKELSSWLDEYSVGELWEKNLLGGRPAA